MVQAGYQALVPGKHDFYFGPERLRQLEKLLRPRGTALLGANLRIQTSRIKLATTIAERFKDRPYATTLASVTIGVPKVVYPWARKFKVSGLVSYVDAKGFEIPAENLARWKVETVAGNTLTLSRDGFDPLTVGFSQRPYGVKVCDASAGAPEDIDVSSCTAAVAPSLQPVKGSGVPTKASFEFGRPLNSNGNYAVCLFPTSATSKEKPFCSTFPVVQPFWTWGYTAANQAAPPPYYIDAQKKFAVFGVLDPSLQESLSASNAGWLNSNVDLDTIVQITDPKEAFEQAFDACVAAHDCVAGTERILLAQMPEEHAGALARLIGGTFLAVIAEANTRQPTPNQTISRSTLETRPIVISPGPIYTPDHPSDVNILLQRFAISEDGSAKLREYKHEVYSKPVPYLPFNKVLDVKRTQMKLTGTVPRTLESLCGKLLLDWGVPETDVRKMNRTNIVERATLQRMRQAMGADIAVLQKRDLFRVMDVADQEVTSGVNTAEVLDRVLWKGDFLLKTAVTGSVLEAVMARSKELADLDSDPNKVETEEGRNLIQTGIVQDPVSKAWYINGLALEKTRLYSVALPDYLTFGDTTYPQFKNPDGLDRPRIGNEKRLRMLSNVVCLGLTPAENCTENEKGLVISPHNLLDNIVIGAPDQKAGYDIPARISADVRGALVPASPLEKATAIDRKLGRTFSIGVEKIEGGFSKYSHDSLSEKQRSDDFAGLNAPTVVLTPESASYTPAARIRGRITGERGDFYLLGEEILNQVQTRDSTDAYVTDLKANLWSLEGGYYWRAFKRAPQRPEWVVLSALRYERAIVDPVTQIKFGSGTMSGSLAKPSSASGRFGLRWDKGDNTNWLEAGYQAGYRLGLLETLSFVPGQGALDRGMAAFTCTATNVGATSLGKCIGDHSNPKGADGKAVPEAPKDWTFSATSYTNSLRWGPFLRFRIDWPLLGHKELAFVSEGNVEFYHRLGNDVETDTRLFADWSAALRFKLWENLGIGPKYQRTYFENKVHGKAITGQAFSFGLEYRFEWRPGLPAGKALRVPYPPK
jgi:hypothetical protein